MKNRTDEEFVMELAKQKKRVDEKIGPIKQSYDEGKITKREYERKEERKEDTEINTISQ
jgi:hypothetical protein